MCYKEELAKTVGMRLPRMQGLISDRLSSNFAAEDS